MKSEVVHINKFPITTEAKMSLFILQIVILIAVQVFIFLPFSRDELRHIA
jgi:hypothetical protein